MTSPAATPRSPRDVAAVHWEGGPARYFAALFLATKRQ